jgi:WD40 repeat protein
MTGELRRYGAPVILALVACSTDATGPVTGTLTVSVATSGEGSDPDGYLVVVNRSLQRSVPSTGSVLIEALPPGDLQVLLQGVAFNCTPAGEGTRQVSLAAGDTAQVAFEVVCFLSTGTLRIAVTTTGADPDPSGYRITLDDTPGSRTEPTGINLLTVGAGPHAVSLSDLNPNCEIAEPAVRQIDVPARGEMDLAFEVRCRAADAFGRGREIVYQSVDPATDNTVLYSVNDDGTHSVRLFPEIEDSVGPPAWAPDGVRLGFYSYPSESETIFNVADPSGGARTQLPEGGSFLSWSPDGTRVLAPDFNEGCPAVRILRIDGSGADFFPMGCSYEDLLSPSWSPDGRRIAFIELTTSTGFGMDFRVPALADFATPGETTQVEGCGFGSFDVVWSPDGSRLAFGGEHIFVVDLNTGVCTQVTDGPWTDRSPSWSPDGRRLAFSSTRDGNAEIYVVDADGGNPTRITRNPAPDRTPTWRP